MSDVVDRLNEALSGRYEIVRQIGEGGMATVYLAEDLRHGRRVAVKVLRPELAAVVGGERFLAEIKTTANLQHPHILPLFDSGEADGFLFYVMPYVEGESLRSRIDREKQLSVTDAVELTRKVADALDYAHGRGIVHRDIKPGNILLSERGEPLVADFGIALAVAQAGGGRITETGLSLGTPHYMAPEQATGERDVDARSDVYALGCVLYEMLTGQPPFLASTAQGVLVQILTRDAPSVTAARRTVPAHVADAIARALEKLPADRFGSAAEFGGALGDENYAYQVRPRPAAATAAAAIDAASQTTAKPARPWVRDPRSVVALVAVVLVGTWGLLRSLEPRPSPEPTFRAGLGDFEVRAPLNSGLRLAISRDGSHIAVVSDVGTGGWRIFLRRVGEREFREVPGTQGAGNPSFSPDGVWLVFEQDGQLKRTEVSGGPVLRVVDGGGPHWGTQDMLVFDGPEGISWVAPFGGEPSVIVPNEEVDGSRPQLLPDGRAILFQGPGSEGNGLFLAEIESGEVVDLEIPGNNPRYVPTGHLVYGHESQALMAVPFDLDTHLVTGEPVTVLPSVLVYGGGWTQFSVSDAGTAVYALSEGGGSENELVLVDPDGVETASPLGPGVYRTPRFSPDGRFIAYDAAEGVRVWDRETGANPLLASEPLAGNVVWPSRSPYVYFGSRGAGAAGTDVFRRLFDLSGEAEQLFRRNGPQYLVSATPDGTQLLFLEISTGGGRDLRIMTQGPDSAIFADYLVAPWNEIMGAISRDGDRVAYVSDESGIREVYVRSFPDGENQLRISDGGGTEPVWAPDGSGLYYLAQGALWRADLMNGAVTERRRLFEGSWVALANTTNWDVHPDGDRFVFVRSTAAAAGDAGAGDTPVLQLEVAFNWFDELHQRMGDQ